MLTRLRLSSSTLGVLIASASLAACGTASAPPSSTGTTAAPNSSGPTSTTAGGKCSFTSVTGENTAGRHPGLPPQPSSGPTTATFTTSAGTFTIKLDASRAPCTTSSFRHLAEAGFFDNTRCHRLTTAASGIYVLQCGDPTGTGTGGPGYTIPDENLAGATYTTGTVAMANTGAPHSGGSQFFIVYKTSPLPSRYTPFGTVSSGLSVIERVAAAGSTGSFGPGDGAPKIPVEIKTVRMS